MFVNTGRNRGFLFIRRVISIPLPTGVVLTGVKLTGVKINIPYLEYDFSNQNLTSAEVNAVLQFIDAENVTELTWRVIYIDGNEPITDAITYNSLIAKGFEIYGIAITTEADKVILRLDNPSVDVQFAITEYIENEQAALPDNWNLTDEVFAFSIDSSVNSLIGWKQFNASIKTGSPIFNAYDGISFTAVNEDSLTLNLGGDDLPNMEQNDAFATSLATATSVNSSQYIIADAARRIYHKLKTAAGIRYIFHRINNANSEQAIFAQTGYKRHLTTTQRFLDLGQTIRYNHTQGGTSFPGQLSFGAIYHVGDSGLEEAFLEGKVHFAAYGAGNNLDAIAHQNNVDRYMDRMLIKKWETEVSDVLSRYSGLTDVEIFEISRLVAKSYESENWNLLDELLPFSLYLKDNAKIGMKQYTATYGGGEIHTSGVGVYLEEGVANNLASNIDMSIGQQVNFNPDLNDSIWGEIIFSNTQPAVSARAIDGGTYRHVLFNNGNFAIRDAVNDRTLVGAAPNYGHMYSRRQTVDSLLIRYYRNGVEWSTRGGYTPSGAAMAFRPANATIRVFYLGGGDGFDHELWNTHLWQFQNGLEINKADLVDWNIINEIYDWSNRSMLPDQLENLCLTILENSDDTTNGRTLDITGNLGVTMNCQLSLDQLVTNGWIVIQ